MKTIIAGSRSIRDFPVVRRAIEACEWAGEITEVCCGGAYGPDRFGRCWAERNRIPVRDFVAVWETHGKAAGPIRNEQMAADADALILVWDGKSSGSADMLRRAKAHGLKIYEHIAKDKVQP